MTSSARANPAYSWIRANDTGDEIVGAADHAADAARTIVNEFLAGHLDTWKMIALAMTSFALLWISRGFITRLFVRKSSVQNVANVHNLFAKLFSRVRTHFLAFSSLYVATRIFEISDQVSNVASVIFYVREFCR